MLRPVALAFAALLTAPAGTAADTPASSQKVTCASGVTAYAPPGMRFFGVDSGRRRPMRDLYVCTSRGTTPRLLGSGRRSELGFGPFRVPRGRGSRHVGWEVIRTEGGTADYDAYSTYRIGWVRLRDGLVRSVTGSIFEDELPVYAVDDRSGAIATLTGAPGGPQAIDWHEYLPRGEHFARAPRTVLRADTGAVVPSSFALTSTGRLTYRTRAGRAVSLNPATAPIVGTG